MTQKAKVCTSSGLQIPKQRALNSFTPTISSLGRTLLVRILDNFVNKFGSLKKQIPKLIVEKPDKNKEHKVQSQKKRSSQAKTLSTIKGMNRAG